MAKTKVRKRFNVTGWLTKTLAEARQFLKDNMAGDGAICPCCGQIVEINAWKYNAEMAYYLIRLYRLNQKEERYYHIREIHSQQDYAAHFAGGSFAKNHHWELITQMSKDPSVTSSRTSGYWKITEKGKEFVKGVITIPSRANTYNWKARSFSGPEINIHQALTSKFNYEEMMGEKVNHPTTAPLPL